MKLSRNSWHVGLNDFIYGYGYSEDNKNLCPYFWGTILAIIGLIPVIVARGLSNIMSNGLKTFLIRYGLAVFWTGIGIVTFGALWFVGGLILFAINFAIYNTNILEKLGKLFFKNSDPKPPKPKKEKRPSMAIEMMKGWKNKHCPMVEWE